MPHQNAEGRGTPSAATPENLIAPSKAIDCTTKPPSTPKQADLVGVQQTRVWTAAHYFNARNLVAEVVKAKGGWFAIVHCVIEAGRFWWDYDNGEECAVIQALDDGELLDFVAWPLADPERFGTACGTAPVLGAANLFNAAKWSFGQVLRIHRTPLRWLQHGGEGVCLLDSQYGPVLLRQALGALEAEDEAHMLSLDRMINRPHFTSLQYRRTLENTA